MKESSRRLLGGEPEEKSTLQEMEEAVCSVCPKLSWRNRLIGYGACLALGFFLTLGSTFRLDRANPSPAQGWFILGLAARRRRLLRSVQRVSVCCYPCQHCISTMNASTVIPACQQRRKASGVDHGALEEQCVSAQNVLRFR